MCFLSRKQINFSYDLVLWAVSKALCIDLSGHCCRHTLAASSIQSGSANVHRGVPGIDTSASNPTRPQAVRRALAGRRGGAPPPKVPGASVWQTPRELKRVHLHGAARVEGPQVFLVMMFVKMVMTYSH